ncbi:hypothetical protein [Paenibacillus mucilaginosus]|uniref:Uncharacterized protein n=1 Tax=Paenibacillus mucilaginosus (strain KNP414) TaxID=1036673 RepID=F8FNI7_PAEMK|nr:hypothetical protein [Paenibacillus mucilaginosus]AEI40099.1 hypothetical protein KNP414_01535 [Paenibacillus mucilaginosus KNP414]MCG7215704.1 hypothetical protein [Paenibacillus mucilaginosus]WDM29337.1 hypothetical protein KCX80_09335 [Paenibacillus mucilaginosus]
MNFALNVFFGGIEFIALIVLSLSIFRFQFYYYLPKIAGIAFLMSFISFYFRYIPELTSLAIISALTTQVILIMITYRIPFFYSLLVNFCGFMASSLVELSILISGIKLGLFNEAQVQQSALTLGVVQVSVAIILSIIIYILQSRKIGFLFKTKNLNSRTALKGYNFVIATILVIGLGFAQIELVSFYNNSLSFYISIIMAFLFSIGIFLAYRHNKEIIRETYERPVKNELDRSYRNEDRKSNSRKL